jgi:hypothetical protein
MPDNWKGYIPLSWMSDYYSKAHGCAVRPRERRYDDGDFSTSINHCSKVIDFLQNDRTYSRCTKLVNEWEDIVASTCGVEPSTLFFDYCNRAWILVINN